MSRAIDGETLYERACDLEAQALAYVGKIANDETKIEEWKIWSAILVERTAFKHDIFDAPEVKPEPHWIPCSERLPENRVDVLICYREWQKYAKRYVYAIVNGWYARKYSVKENVFSEWEMDSDYKEDEDEFYIPEGWYEFTTQGNGDLMNWFINAEVIAWMPLPEPYKEGE